ncbi:Glycerophosphoryl diester phosphodiesterase family-domain-containing protein [Dissophora ornata]|nr:Glycerophosphoryl diester phosphodiesterase family-domain-containing protein [Dissophora ornata]
MKFGKTLFRNQIPEWGRHYLNYKGLKKEIKNGQEALACGESSTDDVVTAFIFHLDREVEKVNSFFIYKRSELERRLRILSENDPEADAECLQAMIETKEMLSKLAWFAEMNRRAIEKILKKFDKRMATANREVYLSTKVNPLPFVFDGQLLEMTVAIDVLIREMRALVADYPPFKTGLSPKRGSAESRLGLTEQQIEEAISAIERDDVATLKSIIDSKLKQRPELEGVLFTSAQSLFRKACEEKAFQCISLMMSFGAGTLMVNVNEQTVLHKLAIEGGNFTKTPNADNSNHLAHFAKAQTQTQIPPPKDDPELIAFILKELSKHSNQDSLCTLTSTADIFGRRPLHYAAMHGFPNITKAFISDLKESGEFIDFSDPYWFDTDGFTPLIYAIMPSTPMTVLNPLAGSEVNLHAVYTYTPLSIACRLGHVDAARLLISYGANLDAQDEDGESCIIIASKNGHVECVKLLIVGTGNGNGANLELRERYYGWTALHLAAIENHPEVVKVLLAAGANPNVYDYSSWNPHEHAVFAANNVCADLLRLVSINLDERQRLQKLNPGYDSVQGSPKRSSSPFQNIATNSPVTIAGLQSPRLPKCDSPPVSGGKSNVRHTKTAQRAYGHKYLEEESLIVVTLGSNDVRSTVEPVELYITGDNNSFLTASTAFSLEITAEKASAGEKVIIDLPFKDSSYHERIVFNAANPEDTILNFSVYPTFGPSSNKLVGRGTAILSSLDNLRKDVFSQHPVMTSLQGMNMTIPIFGAEKMDIIGRVRVEIMVVRPFKHENLKVGSKHTYWKSLTTTASTNSRFHDTIQVIGHRGLGMNRRVSNLQVGENTLLSFVTAANLGAEYVEFDVQMTKDMVPVLYHDWTVTETGLDIPVSAITLEQFQNLSTKKPRGHGKSGSQPSSPKPEQQRQMSVTPPPSVGEVSLIRPELIRGLSNNSDADMKGNGLGTIQAPFATLKDTFETIPTTTGFNIEVKYPMLDEAEDANIPLYSFEMNRFVDRILQEVYDHDRTHPDRNIIFSSFHPDICLLLNMKQPNYPVFFLTDGGTSILADRRCNSIQGAVRFATSIDLLGIVTHSAPIIDAPILIKGIKETGLLVFTYGADNNVVENAKLQRRHGVDAVIVDCLLTIRKGLQQPE